MSGKNKIVLFRPAPEPERITEVSAPLPLLACASLLDKDNFTIKIIDSMIDSDYISMVMDETRDAICLGVTAMTGYQIYDGLMISKLVKRNYPHIPVIWGGWHPTIIPVKTVANPNVDIVVKGQGEITFYETVHALTSDKPLKDILGIAYKENGNIINNHDRPIADLDLFPPIPYHLVNAETYIRLSPLGYRTLNYRISQGCPYNCNFCAEHLMSKRRWVSLSAKRMFEEFKYLRDKYKVDSILLHENNTFIDKNKIKHLCQLMIENNLDIKWGNANVRPDQLLHDDELWGLLKRSGCRSMLVGVESGLQEILDLINKDTNVDDTLNFVRKCSQNNIRPYLSFMIGFPSKIIDNKKLRRELDSILDIVEETKRDCNRQQVFISIYRPYPGTPLFKLAVECGMKEPASLEEWSKIDLTKANSPWMTKSFTGLIKYLNSFIFPYTDEVLDKDWEKYIENKRYPLFTKIVKRILHSIAIWRFKRRLFIFPVEWWLLKAIKKSKATAGDV